MNGLVFIIMMISKNICIEFDGEQHFNSKCIFGNYITNKKDLKLYKQLKVFEFEKVNNLLYKEKNFDVYEWSSSDREIPDTSNWK